jgi:hypothetical protein
VLPLSSIVPFAVTLKLQFGTPGMLPDPSSVNVTLVPSTRPLADAEIVNPLPQIAVNVPAIEFAVCDAIWYWKPPQLFADGSVGAVAVCDVQIPTSVGVLVVGAGAGFDPVALLVLDVGASTLDACSNPHAANVTEATRAITRVSCLVIVVTNLSRPGRICRAPTTECADLPSVY